MELETPLVTEAAVNNTNLRDNDDDEWEEETTYLTLEIPTIDVDPKEEHFMALKNLDSDSPILQFDNNIYKGQYDTLLGTELIFKMHGANTKNNNDDSAQVDEPPSSTASLAGPQGAEGSTQNTAEGAGTNKTQSNVSLEFIHATSNRIRFYEAQINEL